MDKTMDFSGYQGYQGGPPFDAPMEQDPFFNPFMQYEQGYLYYRYLTQQMDYKIKCKEFEKMCNGSGNCGRKVE